MRKAFLSMDDYGTLGAAFWPPRRRAKPAIRIPAAGPDWLPEGRGVSLTWPEVDLEGRQLGLPNEGGLLHSAVGPAGGRPARRSRAVESMALP